MKNYIKYVVFGIIGLVLTSSCIFEISKQSKDVVKYMPVTNKTIILDAGHGGIDPGAMDKDKQVKEKDINLLITLKLKQYLESSGALVFLTREEDVSLYKDEPGKTIRQKYNENLKNRKEIIKDTNADIFVSLHMNALQGVKDAAKYHGAQTFYPKDKDQSKEMANYIQKELKRVLDESNNREIKPRDDIYLLKDNEIPSVLIECGFLSNEKEAKLLTKEEYQEKVAWAIYVGIQQYFTSVTNK